MLVILTKPDLELQQRNDVRSAPPRKPQPHRPLRLPDRWAAACGGGVYRERPLRRAADPPALGPARSHPAAVLQAGGAGQGGAAAAAAPAHAKPNPARP